MLSQSGLDVLVLDKQQFPRDNTCAGWITPAVLDLLQIDTQDYQRGRVLQPIRGFRSGLVGGREVVTNYDKVVSYGIRRCQFDHYLLERSGAHCQLGQPVRALERQDGHWIVNGDIRTPLIVGAGGHFCPIARFLGARQNRGASVVAAQEIEYRATPTQLNHCRVHPEVPELFFCQDLKGYGWCFRKGDYLNVGLGRVDREQLSWHVEQFCQFLNHRGKVGSDIPKRFHGHAYQLYERTQPELVGDGMLLVGDAAGLAYPKSGEGIRPAVESGLIAADVILAAGGRYREADLGVYADRIVARFGRPRTGAASDWLPASWLPRVAWLLLASKWFSRQVVLDGWFLHSRERPLALQGCVR